MRALRVRDENAPPLLPAGKTIHQRNKSTPALSNLTLNGGNKPFGAKRTVFADVSNTLRQPAVKDDIQVPGKATELVVKENAILETKSFTKPVSLLRPAQRPLGGNVSKSIQPTANGPIASAIPKHVAVESGIQATNIRKVLSKKVTTIFKEDGAAPTSEADEGTVTSDVPHPHRDGPVPSEVKHASSSQPEEKYNALEQLELLVRAGIDRDPSLIDALQTTTADAEDDCPIPTVDPEIGHSHGPATDSFEYLDALEEQARVIEQERNEELAKSQVLGSDLEEYWDEDEDEEYFDADGYTTARSVRSRGDNTTGGVTIVLAPRVTSKSQRELEAAKQWVESNKSPEDVEDEQWDTSMVAEYGEEIFEYMRSLEVSVHVGILSGAH